jgi:hypothetical protein
MARFPRTEAEVIALAQSMVSGLTDNATIDAQFFFSFFSR